jgi:hypothetical protein
MKKSQAATEFLMTYGWAILILMVVVAGLFSLGVFTPRTPNYCGSVSPITCYDIKLDENGIIEITLSTSDTKTADVIEVKLTSPISSSCPSLLATISTESAGMITCPIALEGEELSIGNRFDGNAKIKYKLAGGSSDHIINLKFSGRIEESDIAPP